ncbi:transglycosylase SLT domain-containing protein [Cupriavidus sp. YAF13]|uniref:transglycosylase SLT domain-containing protein n=1 Tax=Cupriavidus sp. YAF13 TaxID=3233075 RepID=UPI003F90AAFB
MTQYMPTQDQINKTYAQDEELGLPRGLTAKQITKESAWNPSAVSPKGALGYVQLMPKTLAAVQQQMGRTIDPSNFDDALAAHGHVMKQNLTKFGNVPDALRAYNSGWEPEKWDNAETNDYVDTIYGHGTETGGAGGNGSAGMSSVAKTLDRSRRLRGQVQAVSDAAAASGAGPIGKTDTTILDDASTQTMQVAADSTHQVGAMESFAQAASWDTLAGDIKRAFTQDAATPNWTIRDDQQQSMREETPAVWANDDLRNYVLGAVSDKDWSQRMGNAIERADFQKRYEQTDGIAGFTAGAMQFAAGWGDPVMLAATIGAGAVVNVARGAVAARSSGLLYEAAAGAAGNVAQEITMREVRNQDLDVPALIQQAIMGAALGGTGRLFVPRGNHMPDASERAAGANLQGVAERTMRDPVDPAQRDPLAGDGLIGHSLDDVSAKNPLAGFDPESPIKTGQPMLTSVVDREGMRQGGTEKVAGSHDSAANDWHKMDEQRMLAAVRDEEAMMSSSTDKVGDLRRRAANDGSQANVVDLPARTPATAHAEFDATGKQVNNEIQHAGQGVRAELDRIASGTDELAAALANRLRSALKDDVAFTRTDEESMRGAKGLYYPVEHKIEVRADATDYTVLHEAAHALTVAKVQYGRAKPDTAHGKLVKQLEELRAVARAAYEGDDHMTRYYLSNADEFIAGLYSGKTEFLQHMTELRVKGESVLSKLFDSVRKLLGLDVSEASALAKAMGITDQIMDAPLNATIKRADGADFSIRQDAPTRDDLVQNERTRLWTQAIAEHQEVKGIAAKRAEAWYNSPIHQKTLGKVGAILDSVGNTLARSTSKGVRMVASMLAEDPSGLNRQHADSAAMDSERLKHGFRQPFIEVYKRVVPGLLSGKELLLYRVGYSGAAEKRIGKQVAEYRLAARKARLEGTPFDEGAYDKNVVLLGKHLDGFWGNILEASKAAGEPIGKALGGKGFQGHMPYRWDWQAIHAAYNETPEKFNSMKQLFRDQYTAKVVEPALREAAQKAADPSEIIALRTQLEAKVEHLIGNYIDQVRRDPKSRIQHTDNHLAKISEQLLLDEFRGEKVTGALADEFKKRINEIKNDRTRTEFDLLSEHNGVRLLDYVDSDIGRMVDSNSQRFGGQIALARRGLADNAQIDAMKDALFHDGATPEDLGNIDFLVRSLTGDLSGDEFGAAKLMSQGAYASMMGKLGFNALADAAGIATATGVSGMFRALGKGFAKDTALVASLRKFAPGALVHDPRLFNQTSDSIHASAAGGLSEGSFWSQAGQSAASVVGHLSGMHAVSKMLHNGLVPVLADDVITAIRTGKGISVARMEDMGLNAERVARIKEQLDTHEAGRKAGEAIQWEKWDATAADDLVAAIQRSAGQALQRSYVGEAPRWVSETTVGRVIGQFRRFGFLAAEKQTMRNAFIADSNSAMGAVVGLGLAAALYRAKLEVNTLGMSANQRDKYVEDNFTGMKGMQGVMVMFNMSGMAADGLDFANLVMNGQLYGGSSPVAALGYLSSLTGGVAALTSGAGKAVFGTDPVDWQKQFRQSLRMVPGANTVFGTAISNALNNDE